MNKIILSIKRIIFNIEVSRITFILSNSKDNIFSYPMIIDLNLNTEWYWGRFLKGISIADSVKKALELKKRNIEKLQKRQENPPSIEVLERYLDMKERRETLRSVEHYFGKECFDN